MALAVFEIPPLPDEPELDRCLFLCEMCRKQNSKSTMDEPSRWRCLTNTVWSEIPGVQVMAVRYLRRLAKSEAWARELLEDVYLDEDTEAWVNQAE